LPTPPPPRSRARAFHRRFIGSFTERLPAKLAALFLSLVLWLMVGAEEPTDEWVDVRLALVMDSTVALRDSAPRVQALVVGRARELLKLYTELPVLRRVIPANTADDVTLELHPEDVILPGNVSAKVANINPRTLQLRFVVRETRRVPVRSEVHVSADSGLHLTGDPRLQPESVTVRGARDAVRAIESVPTQPTHIYVRDTVTVHSVPLDTMGLRVRITPAQVQVHVTAARDTAVVPARDSTVRPPLPRGAPRGP
jgi:hypothetical protein